MKLRDYISQNIIKCKSLIKMSYLCSGKFKSVITTLANPEFGFFVKDNLLDREVLEINLDSCEIKLGELEEIKNE